MEIFFLGTDRTSRAHNKTEHTSRCVFSTVYSGSGRGWAEGGKNGPQRRTKKWSSRERPAELTSDRRRDGTSGAVVFFVRILKRRSKGFLQGKEAIWDGSGRFRPRKPDPVGQHPETRGGRGILDVQASDGTSESFSARSNNGAHFTATPAPGRKTLKASISKGHFGTWRGKLPEMPLRAG